MSDEYKWVSGIMSWILSSMLFRRDCNGIQYDIREAVCCENKLHPGVSLFCCGKEPYNPGTATCCKIQHGHSTTGNQLVKQLTKE